MVWRKTCNGYGNVGKLHDTLHFCPYLGSNVVHLPYEQTDNTATTPSPRTHTPRQMDSLTNFVIPRSQRLLLMKRDRK
ncbi:hypothetical protein J6590_030126 [Homalodisca vitripennis]|nr:hypothetical protein J6590_030126 [Homalodisca vitripennis]